MINFLKGKQHNSDFDVEGKNWLPLKESDEKSQTSEVNNQIVEEQLTTSAIAAIAETPETLEKMEDKVKSQTYLYSPELLSTLG